MTKFKPKRRKARPLSKYEQSLVLTCENLAYWWAGKIYRASKNYGRTADFDELLSQALLTLCKCARSYDPFDDSGRTFSSYCTEPIRLACMDVLFKNEDKSVKAQTLTDLGDNFPASFLCSSYSELSLDDKDYVDHTVSKLPGKYRKVVKGRIEGVSFVHIGEKMGISKNRVHQIWEDALLIMRAWDADISGGG